MAARCNKPQYIGIRISGCLHPPSSDLRPLAKTPRSHSQSGQWPNKQGTRMDASNPKGPAYMCVQYKQNMHAIPEPAYTRVYAIPQPLVCMQLMSDPRSNQCSCNVHGAAQGNKGTRSLTHEPANVKEMIKHYKQAVKVWSARFNLSADRIKGHKYNT